MPQSRRRTVRIGGLTVSIGEIDAVLGREGLAAPTASSLDDADQPPMVDYEPAD